MSDEVWNVMTMKGGQVSLLKNLTEDECRSVVQRIMGGDPWSQEAIYRKALAPITQGPNQHNILMRNAVMGGSGDGFGVERCEFWGSFDGELEIWPKPDDYDARLKAAEDVAAMVAATNAALDA